ncbi:MAG TPA: helix-turn-helix transcriptional regulator [Streptosporangiaceae bacterium]|jgi:transcriptional regulator with XRE-family HTH domain|nr:helix-turn-helix transcriptional regulator [Streptosporangiaceae bacterium]
MTDDAYGATIAKRRLARRLAELRVASGYTANHVCDILNWGRGKVGRFEANQWKRPEMSDIRDLLRIYNADTTVQDELEDLAIRARARPWWREYPEIFGNEFPGFENDASHIRVFMPLILPGLLQTAAYVEAGLRTGPRSPAWRQKALETRLRRQEILTRNGPTAPKVVAVITEASLMFRWGTRADQYEQIAHLAEISGRPNVELRIQRFADGPYPGMLSMINIFGFPDAEPSLVFMETDYAVEEVSSADSVNAYEEAFSRARDGALEPADTTAFLRQLAEQLE